MTLRFLQYSFVAVLVVATLAAFAQAGVLQLAPVSELGNAQEFGVSRDAAAWVSEDGCAGKGYTDSGAAMSNEKAGEVDETGSTSSAYTSGEEAASVPPMLHQPSAMMQTASSSGTQPGDANDDGYVNQDDVNIVAAHWQETVSNGAQSGDFNGDGKVDGSDVTILAFYWGAEPIAVPEPSTIVLLLSGLVGLIISRRYRRA